MQETVLSPCSSLTPAHPNKSAQKKQEEDTTTLTSPNYDIVVTKLQKNLCQKRVLISNAGYRFQATVKGLHKQKM